mmetsp:Transcript_14381/g.54245  ORF Transcript_14381/g.54245 Transcript_14381/m.54245 type:complete len:295 (-) Transcript_14381:2436-3320(-)
MTGMPLRTPMRSLGSSASQCSSPSAAFRSHSKITSSSDTRSSGSLMFLLIESSGWFSSAVYTRTCRLANPSPSTISTRRCLAIAKIFACPSLKRPSQAEFASAARRSAKGSPLRKFEKNPLIASGLAHTKSRISVRASSAVHPICSPTPAKPQLPSAATTERLRIHRKQNSMPRESKLSAGARAAASSPESRRPFPQLLRTVRSSSTFVSRSTSVMVKARPAWKKLTSRSPAGKLELNGAWSSRCARCDRSSPARKCDKASRKFGTLLPASDSMRHSVAFLLDSWPSAPGRSSR